jgi:hypothetical protein
LGWDFDIKVMFWKTVYGTLKKSKVIVELKKNVSPGNILENLKFFFTCEQACTTGMCTQIE